MDYLAPLVFWCPGFWVDSTQVQRTSNTSELESAVQYIFIWMDKGCSFVDSDVHVLDREDKWFKRVVQEEKKAL